MRYKSTSQTTIQIELGCQAHVTANGHDSSGGTSVSLETYMIQLSSMDCQILDLIIQGRSNREISEHLQLPFETVESVIAKLSTRLNARDRLEMALKAVEKKLL